MEISYRKIPIFKTYFKKKKKKGFKIANLNGKPTKKRRLPIMYPDEREGRGGVSVE
jgi:hypothetical protein